MITPPNIEGRPWYDDPHRFHQELDAAARRRIHADGWLVRLAPFAPAIVFGALIFLPDLAAIIWLTGTASLIALPAAIVWTFNRRNRVIRRVIRHRLCLGCGYSLQNALIDDGAGLCPECGRRFLLAYYRPPVEGYQARQLDDVIVERARDTRAP